MYEMDRSFHSASFKKALITAIFNTRS